MKQSLSSLNFILKADIKQFQTALRQADQELIKTGKSMKMAGGVLTTGITAPLAAATTAMLVLTNKSTQFADSIDDMSIRTGVAKSTLQELSYVAGQIGIDDFPAIEKTLHKLNKSMGDASRGLKEQSDAFINLGVSVNGPDGKLRSISEIFPEIIGKLSSMTNETERNYLSMQIFGKGAAAVITPMTELGEQGMRGLIDRANELGLVMSDESIKTFTTYSDKMEEIKDQVAAAGREMSVGFAQIMSDTVLPLLQDKIIPAIRTLTDWFTSLPSGIKNTALVVTGLVAVLGPVLLIFGKLITVIPTIIAAAKGMSAAMTVLNAVMAANPIGAIIVAVAALVAIFIWAWNKFEGFRMFLFGLWESFKAVFTNIKDLAQNVLGGIGELLVGVFTFDMEKITSGLDKMKKGFQDYGKQIVDAYKSGAEKGKDLAEVTAEVSAEVDKLAVGAKNAAGPLLTLEEQISALEGKLWKEVQANDANATATARLLREKKELLQVYKDQMDTLMSDPKRMTSIKSNQVQVSTVTMGPPEGDVLFKKESEQLSTFNNELKETATVSADVSQLVQSSLSSMAVLAGESLGNLIAGTGDMKSVLKGILGIVADFARQLGEMLIGIGVAKLVVTTLQSISPWVAIAAGVALVALGTAAKSFMSAGPFNAGGGDRGGVDSSANIPQMADGGIVSKATILMAGEAGPEAIIPIGGLMNTIHNAISMNNGGAVMAMQRIGPIQVFGTIEGRLRAGDLYLQSKIYNTKLSELK